MNYEQGEIVLLRFPFSDLSSSKQRPALVLSPHSFNAAQEDVITCLITSHIESDSYGVIIQPQDMGNGFLPTKSRIKT